MQMSPLWRSVLRQLETILGVWGNFNVKPCSNNAFPSPLAHCGFQQMVQRAHFPPSSLYLCCLQNTLLWSLRCSQKSLETRSACPVVCGEAGWWQHSGQECTPGSSSVPTLGHTGCPSPQLRMGFCCHRLWGCAWGRPHQLKLFHGWNVMMLEKYVLLSGLAFSSCIRRKLWGE